MEALGAVVLAKFDAEKGEGKELAAQYKVQGYPTFVLVNPVGAVIDTWTGYGKEHFLDHFGDALADPTTIGTKQKRFDKKPTAADGLKIARYHDTRGEYAEALAVLDATAAKVPDADIAMPRFDTTFSAYTRAETGTVDDVRKAADAVLASSSTEPGQIVQVAEMMGYLARKEETPQLAVAYLGPAMKVTENADDEHLKAAHAGFAVDHALLVEKNPDKAVKLKLAVMPDGWKSDVKQLNSFAWWCFENRVNLAEAEQLGRRGIDLAAPGSERAMILDTTAEICNELGHSDDAVELIRQAIADHPESDYYRKQLTRFEEIRAAAQAN